MDPTQKFFTVWVAKNYIKNTKFLKSTSHTIINLLARIVERDLDCKLYFQILWILKNDCFQHLPGLGLFLLQIESLFLFRIRVPAEIKKFR